MHVVSPFTFEETVVKESHCCSVLLLRELRQRKVIRFAQGPSGGLCQARIGSKVMCSISAAVHLEG